MSRFSVTPNPENAENNPQGCFYVLRALVRSDLDPSSGLTVYKLAGKTSNGTLKRVCDQLRSRQYSDGEAYFGHSDHEDKLSVQVVGMWKPGRDVEKVDRSLNSLLRTRFKTQGRNNGEWFYSNPEDRLQQLIIKAAKATSVSLRYGDGVGFGTFKGSDINDYIKEVGKTAAHGVCLETPAEMVQDILDELAKTSLSSTELLAHLYLGNLDKARNVIRAREAFSSAEATKAWLSEFGSVVDDRL